MCVSYGATWCPLTPEFRAGLLPTLAPACCCPMGSFLPVLLPYGFFSSRVVPCDMLLMLSLNSVRKEDWQGVGQLCIIECVHVIHSEIPARSLTCTYVGAVYWPLHRIQEARFIDNWPTILVCSQPGQGGLCIGLWCKNGGQAKHGRQSVSIGTASTVWFRCRGNLAGAEPVLLRLTRWCPARRMKKERRV